MVVMNPTGDIAVQQRDLILFSTGVMLLIIVPVLCLTVLFAWRYRRSNQNKKYDPNFDHSTTLELVIWACPLLIIIALSAVTWTSTHLLDPFRPLDRIAPGKPVPANTKTLEVEVVSLDWKWLFIYPEQGIATVNELALPVDRPVRFKITAANQFTTFYAPTMAGMIYVMPSMQSQLNAVVNKPGESWGFSGNYTGAGHTNNRFKLRAMDAGQFGQWVAQVKGSGKGALDAASYLALAKPSEKEPVAYYTAVTPGLFDRVFNRCVEAGKPCMREVMAHDMARTGAAPAGEHGVMPPGRDTMPGHDAKPAPALEKASGDPRNRDLSAIDPLALGASRAAHA
jgi:cytochrome o ubiquinol oxidase subunit II